MKKIDLNNTNDLRKFRDSLSAILESRITELELNDAIDSIGKMSFGDVKILFENITARLYESKNGMKLIAKYTNTIKESESLRNLYQLFENINDTKYISNPEMFLNEAVALSKITNRKSYDKDLHTLSNIVKESVRLAGLTTKEIQETINDSHKMINESVDYLVKHKKTLNNLREYVENSTNVLNFFNENMNETEETLSENTIATVEDINKLIAEGLTPWESELVGAYVMNCLSNGNKSDIFEQYKNDCINIIDESLEDEENEDKAQLIAMKERLMEMSFNENTIVEDLINIADLKHTLAD